MNASSRKRTPYLKESIPPKRHQPLHPQEGGAEAVAEAEAAVGIAAERQRRDRPANRINSLATRQSRKSYYWLVHLDWVCLINCILLLCAE